MALRLAAAVHALYASLSPSPAETASHPKPPSSSSSQKGPAVATATSKRRLATTIASTAALMASSRLLAPASASGGVDLRITVPEESREEAEAVVRTHARNLLRVKRLIDAGAWREMQAELRASASNLKQDLYAIINASPLDYAAREKDERRVQEHYGDIVSALDEIFAKIM